MGLSMCYLLQHSVGHDLERHTTFAVEAFHPVPAPFGYSGGRAENNHFASRQQALYTINCPSEDVALF